MGKPAINTSPLLHAEGLTSIRSERTLFRNLQLTVQAGELVHIEGANGAGKSTLLRMLAGLLNDHGGQINWFGQPADYDPESWRRELLFLGHKPAVKAELTALENIQWQSDLDGVTADAWQLLDQIGLLGLEDIPAQQLSAGQQRRIALTRLWYHPAKIWILDEPFTALDRMGIKLLETQLIQQQHRGGMIVMTSHQALTGVAQPTQRLTLGGADWADESGVGLTGAMA